MPEKMTALGAVDLIVIRDVVTRSFLLEPGAIRAHVVRHPICIGVKEYTHLGKVPLVRRDEILETTVGGKNLALIIFVNN
jgi:uncharacterized membrane protein